MYDNATAIDNNTVSTTTPANDAQFDFSVSANVNDQLATLIGQRKEWSLLNIEQAARSDKRLHQILSTIYNMGWIIVNNAHPDQNIQGKFDAYCKTRAHKYHKNTSYFVRICGEVFGRTESNTYSAYGNALNAAFAYDVP